jgi:hypothetical protein
VSGLQSAGFPGLPFLVAALFADAHHRLLRGLFWIVRFLATWLGARAACTLTGSRECAPFLVAAAAATGEAVLSMVVSGSALLFDGNPLLPTGLPGVAVGAALGTFLTWDKSSRAVHRAWESLFVEASRNPFARHARAWGVVTAVGALTLAGGLAGLAWRLNYRAMESSARHAYERHLDHLLAQAADYPALIRSLKQEEVYHVASIDNRQSLGLLLAQAEIGGPAARQVLAKAERWPRIDAFRGRGTYYFVYRDASGGLQDRACAPGRSAISEHSWSDPPGRRPR